MRDECQKVTNKIRDHLDELKKTHNVKSIGIFGSVARGETSHNDVDILVEFTEPVGFFKFLKLEKSLSEIIGKKVDLVTKNALKPATKEGILKDIKYV